MTVSSAAFYEHGCCAADEILEHVFRIPVHKAKNPTNPKDFIVIVGRVSRKLQAIAGPVEAAAGRKAGQQLDRNWPDLSAAQRSAAVERARVTLNEGAKALPRIDAVFKAQAPVIIGDTRKAVRAQVKASISASLDARDKDTAQFVRESHTMYVRDNYGEVVDRLSARARNIVAAGLEKGLGRDDISSDLASAMARAERPRTYWNMIATDFSNRARTFTQVHAFQEAAIKEYMFKAVLDEVTSVVCRFMNGKVFTVESAVKRIDKVRKLKDPEDIKAEMPWLQYAQPTEDGEHGSLYYETAGGRRRGVADVVDTGGGRKDDTGEFKRGMSTAKLQRAGIQMPPLHGHCRSSVVAVV